MKLGLHISHLPLLANEPMVFCAYSDRGAQEINKWTGPGPSGKIWFTYIFQKVRGSKELRIFCFGGIGKIVNNFWEKSLLQSKKLVIFT